MNDLNVLSYSSTDEDYKTRFGLEAFYHFDLNISIINIRLYVDCYLHAVLLL